MTGVLGLVEPALQLHYADFSMWNVQIDPESPLGLSELKSRNLTKSIGYGA